MTLKERYKHWRHSHGFGIHSPSAYRLIREVLRPSPSYGYYGYNALRRLAGHRYSHTELCLLYRLLVDAHPTEIAIFGDCDGYPLSATARLALPHANISSEPHHPQFIIIGKHAGAKADGIIPDCIRPTHIYLADSKMPILAKWLDEASSGHAFISPHRVFIVNNPSLPKQTFTLFF